MSAKPQRKKYCCRKQNGPNCSAISRAIAVILQAFRGSHLASLSWLSSCKPVMAVRQTSCLPSHNPFIDMALTTFMAMLRKAFRGSSFGTCSKKFFNFLFPFTCSHLSLVMTRFPWPPCRKHARLIKSRPMLTKKHCCQEYLISFMENILHVSIKMLPLLSLACRPCPAKNLVWPLANDFFALGNYIFFQPLQLVS